MSRGGKWLCIHLPCSSWGCGANALPALRLHFLKVHRSNESSSTALVLSALWASSRFHSLISFPFSLVNTQTHTNLINNSCYKPSKLSPFTPSPFISHPRGLQTLCSGYERSPFGLHVKVIWRRKQEGGIDWGFSGLVSFKHQNSFKTFPHFPHLYPQ